MEKFKEMISSISFWMAVLGGAVLVLGSYGVLPMETATIIAGFMGFGVVKRTADKVIDK